MFKKGYIMKNKTSSPAVQENHSLDLRAAVEQFVAKGGVIDIIPDGGGLKPITVTAPPGVDILEPEHLEKVQLLKSLVAKGAGISALQYSLRMNRKDIKQMATEHGIKIEFSRPVNQTNIQRAGASDIDDTVAGHAMHYSSLGYTAPEIAAILGLSVRDVRDIGIAYRIEFKSKDSDVER